MANVFSNSMVAQTWAQFTQESGRSHNGQFYFEGRTLFSYGSHYVAGYLAPAPGDPAGAGVAFVNADSRSVSTSRHTSYAFSSARHRGVVSVPNLNRVVDIFASAVAVSTERLNPGTFPAKYAAPDARAFARHALPRLVDHFTKPGNLPGDWRNPDPVAAVAEVLAAAQIDAPERRARAIVAKAGKAAERAKVEEAKAAVRAELAALARFALRDPAEIVARMTADARRVAGKGGAVTYESGKWERQGKAILRAMKAGKAAGHVARVRKAAEVRKAIRATLPAFAAADMRAMRLNVWRKDVAHVRDAIRTAEAFKAGEETRIRVSGGNRPDGAYDMREGAKRARGMAAALVRTNNSATWAAPACRVAGSNPVELAARLNALAAELDSVAERADVAEKRASRRREVSAIRAAVRLPSGEGNPGERATVFSNAAAVASRYVPRSYAPTPLYSIPGAWRVVGWTPAKFRELADSLKAAEATERAELRRIAEEETAEARAEAMRIWQSGGRIPAELTRYRPHALPDGSAYVRATGVERDAAGNVTGGTLETSQGATVPLAHAIRVFRFLKTCRDKGESWQANGRTLPVGAFRVDRVESDGSFRAGCHRIAWGEVAALAERLGLAELAPADTTESRA